MIKNLFNKKSEKLERATILRKKIKDILLYCNNRINEINLDTTVEAIINNAENEKSEIEREYAIKIDEAMEPYSIIDESAQKLIDRSAKIRYDLCDYVVSLRVPDEVVLCYLKISENIEKVPACINLHETNIIIITSENSSIDVDCKEKILVRQFISRMIRVVPPQNCIYSVFDSLRDGASLKHLIELVNGDLKNFNFKLFINENDNSNASCFEARKQLRAYQAEIIKFLAGCGTLFDCYNKSGETNYPLSWYIDFNFPDKPDEKLINDIKKLFINASLTGYSFIFVTTLNGYNELIKLADFAGQSKSVIHIDIDELKCQHNDNTIDYTDDTTINDENIYSFINILKEKYRAEKNLNNRIINILKPLPKDATKGLSIPIAINCDDNNEIYNLELGGSGSAHGFITGSTNSGKSTLLHTIILSACLHYSPDDLEIWLVDYNQTEFHLYKQNTPPHIKIIGISRTSDFTFSLLDRIEEEANSRARKMMRFNAQNLEDYRNHKGDLGYEHLKRLLIIIDEFHEISQFVSSELNYQNKLENMLRQYRIRGITCLMADQIFSAGLSGLTLAAKNQIGKRLAMRNESSPQEIHNMLEIDRSIRSDDVMQKISMMNQGEFVVKVYNRNYRGEIVSIELKKFKGLFSNSEDIKTISKALQEKYKGSDSKDLIYVNTTEQVCWNDEKHKRMDVLYPIGTTNIRLYLGRSATLTPCFALDMGRQPNENLSIVGGTTYQRWELLISIIHSCQRNEYNLIVFVAEYSDLMNEYADNIKEKCSSCESIKLVKSHDEWQEELKRLNQIMDKAKLVEDTVCIFIGLDIVYDQMLVEMGSESDDIFDMADMVFYTDDLNELDERLKESNNNNKKGKVDIIRRLFSQGSRYGIRCITEVSVYRQLKNMLKLEEFCRHKIAFDMSSNDCLWYLGNNKFQKAIGRNAIYSNGGGSIMKLLPYKLSL